MLRSASLLVVTLLVTGCGSSAGETPGTTCPGQQPEDGFRALFDGSAESAGNWQQAGPGGFRLQDCALHSFGGLGLLWHEQPLDGPYELRVDWRVAGDDNSGVFVGFPEPGDDPLVAVDRGREVQVDATDVPAATTGAVYAVQAPDTAARDAALRPPGEWNTFAIRVVGRRVVVALNGVTVNDYTETDDGRLVVPGHVGLQNHGEGDDVSFRRVRVRDLD